jgi:selenocysteine lyase/cysteine desulfurase
MNKTASACDNHNQAVLASPDFQNARLSFVEQYPSYPKTESLDAIRRSDYAVLDDQQQVYLDYTGSGLYAASQVAQHLSLLGCHVFGNPHSSNPTSRAMTEIIERVRASVLSYFNASPDEYECIFTANASGALKLVGESYPFAAGGTYLLTFDNHNSVNGIREYARARGGRVQYVPVLPPEMRLNQDKVTAMLQDRDPQAENLFAFPAQSNFSGVQHDLDWVNQAQALGWDVLLDCAAFVPTNRLDLQEIHPDFVTISFYKMFGYPTGVGALLARRPALTKLKRPWFAGGTITVASVQGDKYFLHEGAEGFEDGTLNFLTLPAVEIGLQHLNTIGIDLIHERVRCLTGWLLESLHALEHANGKPLVKIYGPLDTLKRGGTITFNLFGQDGHFIDHVYVEQCANALNISLRTGCFCNPGGGELALGLSSGELLTCFGMKPRMVYEDFRRCIDDKSTGAVRISVGLVSTFEDVYVFLQFIRQFLNREQ